MTKNEHLINCVPYTKFVVTAFNVQRSASRFISLIVRPAEDEDLNPHSIANIPRIKGLCAAKSVLVYGAIIVPKGKIVFPRTKSSR